MTLQVRVFARAAYTVALLGLASCTGGSGLPFPGQGANPGPCCELCNPCVVQRTYFPRGVTGHDPSVELDPLMGAEPLHDHVGAPTLDPSVPPAPSEVEPDGGAAGAIPAEEAGASSDGPLGPPPTSNK